MENSMNINWGRWIYGKTREDIEKSTFFENRLLHILILNSKGGKEWQKIW